MKKKFLMIPAMASLVFALCACNNDNNNAGPLPSAEPIVLKPEYATKTADNRSFAFDLFKTTVYNSGGENIFISPYSVNSSLGMVWNGTTGETSREMQTVLGNDGYTKDQINDYVKTLTNALLKADPSTELKIANSLWADKTTPFLPSFIQTNQYSYNATVNNVDFTDPETFHTIDRWGLENTNNRIDKITEGMSTTTKFALINAVYFKGTWKTEFDKSATHSEPFTGSTGVVTTVNMMNQQETLYYADDAKDWKMLELPYGNGAFSMLILMPYSDEPLDEKITSLTEEHFYSLRESLSSRLVAVKLPKFKAEYTCNLAEKNLPDMGLKRIFDSSQAEMSGMCQVPMSVNMVMHKTYIDVYEEGTEAAAVTSSFGITSVGPDIPISFFVDRPFIYSIVENSTETILFMGRVNNL